MYKSALRHLSERCRFPPFKLVLFGSGYRPRSWLLRRRWVPSCVNRVFLFFLVSSYLHYNNDRMRYITVLMYVAAADFQHHVSDALSTGFLWERATSLFTSTNGTLFMDVTVMWRKSGSQQDVRRGTAAQSFFIHPQIKDTAPLNEAVHFPLVMFSKTGQP